MRFTGICLITENMIVLKEFYKGILQAEILEESEDYINFSLDGGNICIYTREGMEGMALNSTRNIGYGGCTIEIEVKDVDSEYEKLKAKNVTIIKLPTTQPWGIRSVWVKDPDGNIINLHMKVSAKS